jgi:hypothetical protein
MFNRNYDYQIDFGAVDVSQNLRIIKLFQKAVVDNYTNIKKIDLVYKTSSLH